MSKPYKEVKVDGVRSCVQRVSDAAFIPLDEGNTDYQEFLARVAAEGESTVLEAAE